MLAASSCLLKIRILADIGHGRTRKIYKKCYNFFDILISPGIHINPIPYYGTSGL